MMQCVRAFVQVLPAPLSHALLAISANPFIVQSVAMTARIASSPWIVANLPAVLFSAIGTDNVSTVPNPPASVYGVEKLNLLL
jgi:hypothetical protein